MKDEITGETLIVDNEYGMVLEIIPIIEIPIVINKYTKLPVYETEHASGMDVKVNFGDLSDKEASKKRLEERLGSDFEVEYLNDNFDVTLKENKFAIILWPLGRYLFPTGIHVSIPVGYEIQVRARSGLAIKQGVGLLNSVGTIDADYRGEIGVILVNLSNRTVKIYNDDKIAQLVLCKVDKVKWNVVDTLDETNRGEGGFGSTTK